MRFDGGILSTVKEYILDKNGEKVKLKNGNYKTRKIDTVDWNEQGKAEEWRKSWADITNKAYTKLKKNKQDTFYNEYTAEIILFERAFRRKQNLKYIQMEIRNRHFEERKR